MQYTAATQKGHGRGKSVVKFPTFNLAVPPVFDYKQGVYACTVWIENMKYRGAMHYGPTPTFDDTTAVLEIFVLAYESDAPVAELTFEVGAYLRPVATFLDPQKLRAQIALDVQRVRRAIALP